VRNLVLIFDSSPLTHCGLKMDGITCLILPPWVTTINLCSASHISPTPPNFHRESNVSKLGLILDVETPQFRKKQRA